MHSATNKVLAWKEKPYTLLLETNIIWTDINICPVIRPKCPLLFELFVLFLLICPGDNLFCLRFAGCVTEKFSADE